MSDHPTATLRAFRLIAEHGSFTRAAAALDVTPSALSQALRQLEHTLGVRLFNRTTRRVGLTEAGRDFLESVGPALTAIDTAIEAAREHGNRPAGTLRVTTAPMPLLTSTVTSAIPDFLQAYPDITLDISVDNALTDLIKGGFDAGIRLGERLQRDMVALPLTGLMRSRVVGAPAYFERHGRPRHPRELTRGHNCVRYRFPASGAIYRWEFANPKGAGKGRWFEIDVSGNLIVNQNPLALAAVRSGLALAHLPESLMSEDLESGRLQSVLDEWLPPYDGLYLYYPSRFQVPPKLRVFIDFLRARMNAVP